MLLTYILWVAIVALQVLLIVHLLRLGLARRYPYFFSYLILSGGSNLIKWTVYHLWNAYYPWCYWILEFVVVWGGFLVVAEVFCQAFHPFPSIRRVVGWSTLILLLVLLAAHIGLGLSGTIRFGWYEMFFQIVRWGRFVQAGLLALLVAAARYYLLPWGRNVAGLGLGFGLYVSLIVVSFALQALGRVDLTVLSHLYSGASLMTLGIWLYAFWVYAPNPLPARPARLEQDYARLNLAVTAALLGVRGTLRKAAGI